MTSLSSFSIPIFNGGYYTQQKLPWMVPRAIKNGTQWIYPYPWPSLTTEQGHNCWSINRIIYVRQKDSSLWHRPQKGNTIRKVNMTPENEESEIGCSSRIKYKTMIVFRSIISADPFWIECSMNQWAVEEGKTTQNNRGIPRPLNSDKIRMCVKNRIEFPCLCYEET